MSDESITPPGQPSAERPLDRTHAPGVPPAVADLWDGWGYPGGTSPEAVAVALGGVTSIVNAMAGGDRYSVGLGGASTAWTDIKGHRVAITSAALADPRLTVSEALGVTTAMAVHEAGHARLTAPMQRAVERAFGKAGTSARADRALRLSNIVDDVRLEARTADRWPAYGPLFPLAMWWVAQRYPSGKIARLPASQGEAVNFGLAAIRYGDLTEWATDPAIAAERAWWADWGQRAASHDRPKDHVGAISEALDRIAGLPEQVEQPQPPQPGQPGQQPDESESEDQDEGEGVEGEGESDESEDQDDDEPGDEPEQSEGSGSDWSDEADADEDEDEATGGEWDDDADDEPGEGTPAPSAPSESDEDGDESDEDEDEDEDDEPGDGETDGPDTYLHRDEPTEGDEAPEDDREADATYYGPAGTDAADWDPTEGIAQDDRDALTSPLPAHAADAVADDDRNRDIALDKWVQSQAVAQSRETIEVRHDGGEHIINVDVRPLVTARERVTTDQTVQQAIRGAFTSRRTARDARDVARSGRVSGHRAYRVAAGFDNVFTRRDQISPDRLDVHLLVDASGSMGSRDGNGWGRSGPTRLSMAAQMAANITEALARLPYIRVHVWAHNNLGSRPILHDVYDSRKGEPLARIAGIVSAGDNRDASAIRALSVVIERERSRRERSVMVVISDGAPCEPEPWVRGAVEATRQRGIGVVSVAIAGGLTSTQEACYGTDMVVPWHGDWDALTRGMAKIMGKIA